jgi:regulatory protein
MSAGIDPRALQEESDEVREARAICSGLLSRRPRTRAELEAALSRRGVPPGVSSEALDLLAEAGLIDDVAFAEAWVGSRHAGRGLSRRVLADELRRHGVARPTVERAVGLIDDAAEYEAAWLLVVRRIRQTAGLPYHIRSRRLSAMLARRGYSPGLAMTVVRQVLAEAGETNDDPDGPTDGAGQEEME